MQGATKNLLIAGLVLLVVVMAMALAARTFRSSDQETTTPVAANDSQRLAQTAATPISDQAQYVRGWHSTSDARIMLDLVAGGTGKFLIFDTLKWSLTQTGIEGSVIVSHMGDKNHTMYFSGHLEPSGRLKMHFTDVPNDWIMMPDMLFDPN